MRRSHPRRAPRGISGRLPPIPAPAVDRQRRSGYPPERKRALMRLAPGTFRLAGQRSGWTVGSRRRPAPGLRRLRTRLARVLMLIIRLDDVLNQFMTNDVTLVEIHELNAFDVAEDIADFDQTRHTIRRQINLGDVA